jgi:hypothetical protein
MGFGLMGSGTFVATRYGDEIIGGVSRFGDEVAEGVSRIWTGRGYERYVQRVLDADDGFSVGGRQFDGSWKSLFGEVWLEMKTFIKPDKIAQAKSQIGQQYRIATDNGVGYMVVSPSPLPAEVVDYLSKMGIDHMIIP